MLATRRKVQELVQEVEDLDYLLLTVLDIVHGCERHWPICGTLPQCSSQVETPATSARSPTRRNDDRCRSRIP